MGKSLIIPGADFSANAIATDPNIVSGELFLSNFTVNITNDSNSVYFGRMSPAANEKRIGMYASEFRPIRVPKGSKITLFGISGLCLDYCRYSQDFDMYAYRRGSNTNEVYENGKLTSGVKLDFAIESFSKKVAANYFTWTNGSQSSVTLVNNNDGEWFVFLARNTTDSAVGNASNYRVSYLIQKA